MCRSLVGRVCGMGWLGLVVAVGGWGVVGRAEGTEGGTWVGV